MAKKRFFGGSNSFSSEINGEVGDRTHSVGSIDVDGSSVDTSITEFENISDIENLTSSPDKGSSGRGGKGKTEQDEKSKKTYKGISSIPCSSWEELEESWRKAMKWRRDLSDTLCTMLAVAQSTEHLGDQLFLQVIGDAGSGKSRFCDGMLTSPYCYALEHLTGFYSGFSDGTDKDFSLLARINNKTLITPEADVIVSSPKFQEIMGQQRKIYDGSGSSSYKNQSKERRYDGLRTPWIMCGTPALLKSDQSRLGDRFIRIFIDKPDDNERKEILRRVGYSMYRAMATSKGLKLQAGDRSKQEESIVVERLLENAYRLTGGFVDHIRKNYTSLIPEVNDEELDTLVERCGILAEFTADMRARPDPEWLKKGKNSSTEQEPTKELPTRLQAQFVRLALCLSGVMGKHPNHSSVWRRVVKVSMDTSRGLSFDLLNRIFHEGNEGITLESLAEASDRSVEGIDTMLLFLRKIGVVEVFKRRMKVKTVVAYTQPKFRLTDRMANLYEQIRNMD